MKTWKRFRPRVEELERRLVPSTLAYSTNWSGYAVNTGAGAVSQVAGSWVVPAVSNSVSGYSSAWVGIDGWGSSTVEQIGTDSDYVNGHAQYYAWYEMYPAAPVNLSLAIHPGDTISASVSYSGLNQFVLSIADVTTGGSFSTTQTLAQAQLSSAEWIQEAPSSFTGVLPLANFGTINFSGANATVSGTPGPADNSWSGSTLYQIDMVTRNGSLKATTSALSDAGAPLTSSFSVTWVSSGSGGHGGGHHSTSVPPPDFASTAALVSAAVARLAASPQGTPPVFVATQSPTVTVAPAAAVARPALPALTAVTAASAHFGPDTGNPGRPVADQADTPELPLRSGAAVPADRAAQADGLASPQADRAPASWPGPSRERARAVEVAFADGFWLPASPLEGMQGTLEGGRGSALAGLVLALALVPAQANATQGRRDGVPDRQNRDGRRFQPSR
jgi:hypothetical protein